VTHDSGALPPHPDIDQLADLDAGVDVTDDVRTHAATCAQCQEVLAALGKTRVDLAGFAADAPDVVMPADVADRLDTALANEATSGTPTTVVPFAARDGRGRRGGLIAGGVAASVVALLIAALVLNSLRSHDKPTPTQAGGAAAGASTSIVTASGRNYTAKSLPSTVNQLLRNPAAFVGDSAAGATGTAGAPSVPGSNGVGKAPAPSAATGPKTSTLAESVPQQLGVLETSNLALDQCIQVLLGQRPEDQRKPLAVDLARFDGKSAAIFVFPGRDPSHLRVYVVPPDGCATGIFSLYNITKS
jgi:hypothetical protein